MIDPKLNPNNVLIGESGSRYFIKNVESDLVYYSKDKERRTRIQGVSAWLMRMRDAKVERRQP